MHAGQDAGARAGALDIETFVEREAPKLLDYFARRVDDREDAADLLGETLTVVWRKQSAIPSDPTRARMWLYGVARKVVATHRRTTGRRRALLTRLAASVDIPPTPQDAGHRVRELVDALRPLDREIIGLHYWEGFTFEEIARILGSRPATIRSRHARARLQLREALVRDGVIAE